MLTQKELSDAIEKGRDALESKSGRISLQLKAATDTIVSPNPGGYVLDPDTPAPSGDSVLLRTLIPNIPVSGSGAVTYFQLSQQGNPSEVAEDAQKPQFNAGITGKTLPLVQIAGIEKISEEALDDVPQLIRTAEQFARASKDHLAFQKVISGRPALGEFYGIATDSGIATSNYTQYSVPALNSVLNAIEMIEQRGFTPNAIVASSGWLRLIIGRTKLSYEKQFSQAASAPASADTTHVGTSLALGGMFTFAPAFGATRLHIAGLPVITMASVSPAQGRQFLVGDFARGAAIYTAGEKLEIGRDDDDFSHDRYTLRISERMNVALKNLGAFQWADIRDP